MDQETLARYAGELYRALRERHTVPPLTEREPAITVDDAYRISVHLRDLRVADGEKVIGQKIGVTSKGVQSALGVYQPDFGYLTDRMRYADGAEMPIGSALIQPRAEGEIAL